MEGRRILLLVAILLLLTAAAGSLVQVPEETEAPEDTATERLQQPETGEGRAPASGPAETREVAFGADRPPSRRSVPLEAHVIVTVDAPASGEVELEGLDLLQPVEPRTPAVFDLFTDRAGSFDVLYTPVEDETRRIGTLTVERAPTGEDSQQPPARPRSGRPVPRRA